MKLAEIFIGQIVEEKKELSVGSVRDQRIPRIGKVVDIALQYDVSIISQGYSSKETTYEVFPVVHFLGDTCPRTIRPEHLQKPSC